MRILRLPLLVCLLATAANLQAQSNSVGTIIFEPSLYSEGYTLVYPHNQPHARLIDACGEVVHMWTNDSLRRPGNSAYLTPMGNLIWAHRPASFVDDAIWAGGGGAVIEARSWDNEVLWNYTLNDSTGRLHHDFAITQSGSVLAIAWERIDSLEAVDAGRDPALLEGGELWSERIIELQPNETGGADVVWEWRAWDHLIQDFDSTKMNYGVVSEAPERINVNFGTPSSQAPDWLHMNSIDYHGGLNQILLSVPTFDELWIIDKGSPDNGLIWRWGNPEAYGQGVSGDQQLHYQHAATWLDAPYHQGSPDFGKIGVFNNRNPGATGPYSSVHLLDPTWNTEDSTYASEGNTYAPETFDWSWTAPVPTDFFSSGLSNFERLPNGNNLILGGRTGEIFEITPQGDTAWYYRVPIQSGQPVEQGTELGINSNLLFRAVRYPEQFPAFNGADLTPMGPWELNPSPLPTCIPCEMEINVNAVNGAAYAEVTGATGEFEVTWMIDDVTLCTGDSLSILDEDACGEAVAMLVDGETITVLVIDEAGCEQSVEVTWIANSIAELNRSLRVYPNPAYGTIHLDGLNDKQVEIKLFSLTGQLVQSFPVVDSGSKRSLSIQGLPSGHYILRVGERHFPLIITQAR